MSWSLIHGHDELLAKWAAARIPQVGEAGFGPCRAIGVATRPEPPLEVLAVIVYHNFVPHHGVCEVSIAAASPRWAQRGVIRALLSVPFEQFGARKLYGAIDSANARACKLIKGLGFRGPAVLRHHFAQGKHAALFDMMAHEYRAKWGR